MKHVNCLKWFLHDHSQQNKIQWIPIYRDVVDGVYGPTIPGLLLFLMRLMIRNDGAISASWFICRATRSRTLTSTKGTCECDHLATRSEFWGLFEMGELGEVNCLFKFLLSFFNTKWGSAHLRIIIMAALNWQFSRFALISAKGVDIWLSWDYSESHVGLVMLWII